MKHLSIKDFVLGVLVTAVFFLLLGAAPYGGQTGRYVASAGVAVGWSMVCVTDSWTAETVCSGNKDRTDFTFMPEFPNAK